MWLHHLRCCFTNSKRNKEAKERRRESSARNPSLNLSQSRTPKERNHTATKTDLTSSSEEPRTRGHKYSRHRSRKKATAAAAASGERGELVVARTESPTAAPTWQTEEEHNRIAHPSGSQSCSVARVKRVEGSFDSPCNPTGQRYFSRWVYLL